LVSDSEPNWVEVCSLADHTARSGEADKQVERGIRGNTVSQTNGGRMKPSASASDSMERAAVSWRYFLGAHEYRGGADRRHFGNAAARSAIYRDKNGDF
jgi:hypothetical protein